MPWKSFETRLSVLENRETIETIYFEAPLTPLRSTVIQNDSERTEKLDFSSSEEEGRRKLFEVHLH